MALSRTLESSKIKTFAYENKFINPTFNSTSNWGTNGAILSASNNILFITGSGSIFGPAALQSNVLQYGSGKKIFIQAKMKVTNSSCASQAVLAIATGMTTLTNSYSNPVNGTEYIRSSIFTLGAGGSGNVEFRLRHNYADAATANGKVMEVREAFVIDLTSLYGAGNEPTAADCANIFKFVDGNSQPNFSTQIVT